MSLVTSECAPSNPNVRTRSSPPGPCTIPRSSAPSRFETDQSSGLKSAKCVRNHEPRACQANRAEGVRSSVAARYPLFERV